jgi:hypothetical protein
MAVKPSSNLLHLPLVIIRLLAEEVWTWYIAVRKSSDCVRQLYEIDRKAFCNFRLVCKACNNESRYLLFHTVVIDQCIDTKNTQLAELTERLNDSHDTLRGHVRHLKIGPFEEENDFDLKLSLLVHDVLKSMNRLQTITWNMSRTPLPAFLDLLNEKHPSARLHVVLRDPGTTSLWTPRPSNLLASDTSWEQLQRLELQGYWPCHVFSSFAHRVPNLKYLKFSLRTGSGFLQSSDPILANFIASTPTLHTLEFGAENIEWLTETLRTILQNLPGSLRILRLSHTTPDYSGRAGVDFSLAGMMRSWEPEHYLEVLELTPGLEHFDAQIAGQTFLGDWEGQKAWADAERKFKLATKDRIKNPFSKKAQRLRKAQRAA